MQGIPHLQALVERHKDDAFVLIGVNTGDSPEAYRKGLRDMAVTWLCAYQGAEAPITSQYAVSVHPTYLLIDAQGKIRARGNSSRSMDKKIAELLEEAKEPLPKERTTK